MSCFDANSCKTAWIKWLICISMSSCQCRTTVNAVWSKILPRKELAFLRKVLYEKQNPHLSSRREGYIAGVCMQGKCFCSAKCSRQQRTKPNPPPPDGSSGGSGGVNLAAVAVEMRGVVVEIPVAVFIEMLLHATIHLQLHIVWLGFYIIN